MTKANTRNVTKAKNNAGRPKDELKKNAILKAAEKLFMKEGMNGTTMDDIADKAGVSKLTVYNNFGTKDQLFGTVIRNKCENYISTSLFETLSGENPKDELLQIGKAFSNIIYSQEAIAIYRVVMHESRYDKKIAQLYNDTALNNVFPYMMSYLEKLETKQGITLDDRTRSADIFLSLFKGRMYTKALLGIKPKFTKPQMHDFCQQNVKLFLKLHDLDYQ